MEDAGAILRDHVRRIAVLRAAQRVLEGSVPRESLERSIAEGQVLFDQLRALQIEDERSTERLHALEPRLATFAADLGELATGISLRALCRAARNLAPREPAALRALGVVLLQGDLRRSGTLRAVEGLVTALACDEDAEGLRQVVRTPLEVLPELARADTVEIHESHPDLARAEQVLGRELRRQDQLDFDASCERVTRFKDRLGARALHPVVLAASVAYNAQLGNLMLARARALDRNVRAECVPGPEARAAETGAGANDTQLPLRRPARVLVAETPGRSRLLWQSLGIVAIAAACLLLAAMLWSRPIDVVEPAVAAHLSPYLVSGYVSKDDGVVRFVGTLESDWSELDAPGRRLVLARIASRLAAEQVDSIVLVDATGSLQARQEGERLHWVASR